MDTPLGIVDVSTWLGAWPFRYLGLQTARALERRLAKEGIEHAFVGTPESALNQDCLGANRLLLRRLEGHAGLHPVITIDPSVGNWRETLRICLDNRHAALRLMPSYHSCPLCSPAAVAVAEEAAGTDGLALFVQVRMEDERTHHPLCKAPGVESRELITLALRHPALPVVALCAYMHEAVDLVRETPNIHVELSHIEAMRTVPTLLSRVPPERVLFGSHTPFLCTRSAVMKLEAPGVPEEARRLIASGNARRLLARAFS